MALTWHNPFKPHPIVIPDTLTVRVRDVTPTPDPEPPAHEHLYRLTVAYNNMHFDTTGTHDECMQWLSRMFGRVFLPDNGAPWVNPINQFQVRHMACIHNECPSYRR